MKKTYNYLVCIVLFLMTWPVYANVGIPVVSFGWPFLISNLIFVVLIEVWILHKLTKLSFKKGVKALFVVNLFTTLIAYPILGILIGLVPALGFNIGWLLPYINLQEKTYYIGLAMTITLVPCFFLSVWLERKFLENWFHITVSWRHVYFIHLASYSFLLFQVFTGYPMEQLAYLNSHTLDFFSGLLMGIFHLINPLKALK